MNTSLDDALRLYLGNHITIHDLREWLTLNEPELSAQEQDLADEMNVTLVHFYDGYAQENEARLRLAAALELRAMVTIQTSWPPSMPNYRRRFTPPPKMSATTSASDAELVAV